MTKSDSTAKLYEALAKAQGAMEAASKDSTNPHFKSKYADLASIVDAVRKPLADNGLAIVQSPEAEGSTVAVTTHIGHSSGEWIEGTLKVTAANAQPQSVGSAITYLRRYALAAMAGIAPDDDDGEAAEGRGGPQQRRQRQEPDETRQRQSQEQQEAAEAVRGALKSPRERILAAMKDAKVPPAEMAMKLGEWLGKPISKDTVLTEDDWRVVEIKTDVMKLNQES